MNHPIYDPIFYRLEWEPVEIPHPFHDIDELFFTREEAEEAARKKGFEWIEVRVREQSTDDENHFKEAEAHHYVKVRPLPAKQTTEQPTAEAVVATAA